MHKTLSLLICLALLGAAELSFGQSELSPDLLTRLNELEKQTESLRLQLQDLNQHPVRLPAINVTSANTASAPVTVDTGGDDDSDDPPWSDVQAEIRKLTWKKGDFTLTPYGAFWADMSYASERTNPGTYTLWVDSPEIHGENTFAVDARRSRFGLDLEGPQIPLFNFAKSFAKVEIDFQGVFVTENKPGVRLRHAYWETKNDDFRFLVGQTRDVISPLWTSTLNYGVGFCGGNIGYRRAQFRYERYYHYGDACLVELQGSLNQNIVPDFSSRTDVIREPSGWPVIEGRLGFVLGPKSKGSLRTKFGVSGHIGETGFDFTNVSPAPTSLPPADDVRIPTWSFNVDLHMPITERFGVQGEYFTGSNLSPFLGGIAQGACPCRRTAIRSTGGWFDVWYEITPRLHTHAGWGLDDPNNNDFLYGRTYNQFVFWNVTYDLTSKLTTGLEISSWKTNYQDRRAGSIPDADLQPRTAGNSVVVEWMMKYGF